MFSRLFFASLVASTLVSAHFQLNYPSPRGEFNDEEEVNFCGGYDNASQNRSTFPISGGFFKVTSGHEFTAGVLLSTVQNPTSFDNFTDGNGQDQLVRSFARQENGGSYCIPLNLNNTGIDGVQDGANVTIQIVFQGSDGGLYQCADVTLSDNFTINEECTNSTSAAHGHDDEGSDSDEGNGAHMQKASIASIGFTILASGLLFVSQ